MIQKNQFEYDCDIIPYYSEQFKINFTDIDNNKELSNEAILKYCQIIAMDHVDCEGYGFFRLNNLNLGWVISSWKVEITKRPIYGQEIIIKTWRHSNSRVRAYRDFQILDENENELIKVSSLWILLDLESRKIVKLSDDTINKFNIINDTIFENADIEKIDVPESYTYEFDYTVNVRDIDSNSHMNNCVYLELAIKNIPYDDRVIKNLDKFVINYKKELLEKQKIKICIKIDTDSIIVSFYNEDKSQLHAICEFKK